MATTCCSFSAELLSGTGMDSLGSTPPAFSSDQGEKFVLSAALYSCHYPGDEKEPYLPWRDLGYSQPNSLFWSFFLVCICMVRTLQKARGY